MGTEQSDRATGERHTPLRILVLEDDRILTTLMKVVLEAEGYQVQIAESGHRFFEVIAEFEPDLVTIDILLPGVDGLHIFRQMSADPLTQHIPVIFVTALEDRRDEGLGLGAAGFIVKPFLRTDLSLAVRRIFDPSGLS